MDLRRSERTRAGDRSRRAPAKAVSLSCRVALGARCGEIRTRRRIRARATRNPRSGRRRLVAPGIAPGEGARLGRALTRVDACPSRQRRVCAAQWFVRAHDVAQPSRGDRSHDLALPVSRKKRGRTRRKHCGSAFGPRYRTLPRLARPRAVRLCRRRGRRRPRPFRRRQRVSARRQWRRRDGEGFSNLECHDALCGGTRGAAARADPAASKGRHRAHDRAGCRPTRQHGGRVPEVLRASRTDRGVLGGGPHSSAALSRSARRCERPRCDRGAHRTLSRSRGRRGRKTKEPRPAD